MNYGLYLSASGVMVNSHRQDVLANNLANVNTAGFKPMFTDLRQRPAERVEDGLMDFGLSQQMLEKLGGGVFGDAQRISFKSGAPVFSGNDLDAALTQDNAFFAVEYIDPSSGDRGVRLTRNGKFATNAAGELVTQSGHRVLGVGDRPIQTGGAQAVIGTTGELRLLDSSGDEIGREQLQITRADLGNLKPAGENLFEMTAGDSRTPITSPAILPRHFESSGTDAITTMMDIVAATKAATGNANMIRYHDQMLNGSINTFGRVA